MKILLVLLLLISPMASAYQYYAKTMQESMCMPRDPTEIKPFTMSFDVRERSIFKASGHVDVRHRGKSWSNKAIVVSLKMKLDGRWLEGSKTGANILNRIDHYQPLMVHGFKVLEPGLHTMSVWMRSKSFSSSSKNCVAEIKKNGYNQVVYEIIPI